MPTDINLPIIATIVILYAMDRLILYGIIQAAIKKLKKD